MRPMERYRRSSASRFGYNNHHLTLHHTIPTFMTLSKKPFENIVGRGENAGNQHFLLFQQCFQPYQKQK